MSDDSKKDENGNAMNDGLVVPQISFRKIKRKHSGKSLLKMRLLLRTRLQKL